MKTSFVRLVSAGIVLALITNNATPALAGFGFSLPSIGGVVKKAGEDAALKKVSELLSKNAPVYYNVKNSYKKVKAPQGFNPQHIVINSFDDLNRRLPAGDYTVDIVTYCSHVVTAHSGSNMGHSIAPAEGTQVQLLANLTLRGEASHVSRAKLQKLKWIIQTGLPLSEWLPEDRKVVHQLIPDFEQNLKGDAIDAMQADYNRLQKELPVLPSFEAVLEKIPFGKQIVAMRAARKVLTEKGISDREVGGRLFQVTDLGNNTPPPVIAPEDSPWYHVSDNVIARAVITNEVPVRGYSTTQDLANDAQLGINRFEFRVLGNQSKELKGQKVAVALEGASLAEVLYGGAETGAVAGSAGGPAGAGAGAVIVVGGGLILYALNHPAQPLTITPAFGGNGGKKSDSPECQKFRTERANYEKEVQELGTVELPRLEAAGHTPTEIAKAMYNARRSIGVVFKNLTQELLPDVAQQIAQRNLAKYGDALGPTYEWLRANHKTAQVLATSATLC